MCVYNIAPRLRGLKCDLQGYLYRICTTYRAALSAQAWRTLIYDLTNVLRACMLNQKETLHRRQTNVAGTAHPPIADPLALSATRMGLASVVDLQERARV